MTTMLRPIIVLAAALASTGCAMTLTVVLVVSDSYLTTSIKSRLATEARVGTLTDVGVQTSDDMVRLTGTVADEAERRHVESLARSVAGDNRVVSELQVAGTASARK